MVAKARLEDLRSVGTRIRWGAILAGAVLAFGIYALLGILGAAVGISISDRVNPTALSTGAIIWALLTTCVAVFVGGLMTTVFTVGENKVEAVTYGVIMWAVLFLSFSFLGNAGLRNGLSAMIELSNSPQAPSWESSAKEAGIPATTIKEWRAKLAANTAEAEKLRAELAEIATRVAWYAFATMWLSMFAAAGGALLGAGPTFRLVVLPAGAVAVTSLPPRDGAHQEQMHGV
jgi:hypothetical protein